MTSALQQLDHFNHCGWVILAKSDPLYQLPDFVHIVENYWRSEGDEVEDELDGYRFFRMIVVCRRPSGIDYLEREGPEPHLPDWDVSFSQRLELETEFLLHLPVYAVVLGVREGVDVPGPDGADAEPIAGGM